MNKINNYSAIIIRFVFNNIMPYEMRRRQRNGTYLLSANMLRKWNTFANVTWHLQNCPLPIPNQTFRNSLERVEDEESNVLLVWVAALWPEVLDEDSLVLPAARRWRTLRMGLVERRSTWWHQFNGRFTGAQLPLVLLLLHRPSTKRRSDNSGHDDRCRETFFVANDWNRLILTMRICRGVLETQTW